MTWILVAARNGAALYEHTRAGGLRRLDRIPGPPPSTRDPSDPAAAAQAPLVGFSLALADRLERGVRAAGVDALVLMAETRLLGAIRRQLSADTARLIHASLNVAEPDWDEASLAAKLAPILGPPRSPPGGADFF